MYKICLELTLVITFLTLLTFQFFSLGPPPRTFSPERNGSSKKARCVAPSIDTLFSNGSEAHTYYVDNNREGCKQRTCFGDMNFVNNGSLHKKMFLCRRSFILLSRCLSSALSCFPSESMKEHPVKYEHCMWSKSKKSEFGKQWKLILLVSTYWTWQKCPRKKSFQSQKLLHFVLSKPNRHESSKKTRRVKYTFHTTLCTLFW